MPLHSTLINFGVHHLSTHVCIGYKKHCRLIDFLSPVFTQFFYMFMYGSFVCSWCWDIFVSVKEIFGRACSLIHTHNYYIFSTVFDSIYFVLLTLFFLLSRLLSVNRSMYVCFSSNDAVPGHCFLVSE